MTDLEPYDIGDDPEMVDIAHQYMEAKTAEAEWKARREHLQRILIDAVPEDESRKVTLAGRPFVTKVVSHLTRFDRSKFDADYQGLYDQYVVPGNVRRYLR